MIIREKGLGLKPCINCDTFAKDPFGVIVQYFDSINGWVLNKVKIREYISLLNTGLYQSKGSFDHLERQLFLVIFTTK